MKHFYNFTLVLLSLFVSAHSQAENAGAVPPPPYAEMNIAAEIYVLMNEIQNLKKRQEKLEEDQKEFEGKIKTAEQRLERKLEIMDQSLYEKVIWVEFGWIMFAIFSGFGILVLLCIAIGRLLDDFEKRFPAPQQK